MLLSPLRAPFLSLASLFVGTNREDIKHISGPPVKGATRRYAVKTLDRPTGLAPATRQPPTLAVNHVVAQICAVHSRGQARYARVPAEHRAIDHQLVYVQR
jgi:hypothetical protein